MTSITLELPDKLAAQVQAHQTDLPRILELGLKNLLIEKRELPPPSDTPEQLRQKILSAWKSSGLIVELDSLPEDRQRIRQRRKSFKPIKARGKPASEIIIEQRGKL
jgi:hypothetical protein